MTDLPDHMLEEYERLAVELATLAGAEIVGALGSTLAVRYKGGVAEEHLFRDPVSEVDHRTEELIRHRLADVFPDHGILGEEMEDVEGGEEGVVWVIDPVDGTTNFINGFPLFAASLGVLHRGTPVAGAVWCSTTHSLRPGVYHARRGGRLGFDSEVLEARPNPAVRRRLAGMPWAPREAGPDFDVRKTGSAAIECAFVAAGLLQFAQFARPNAWDVAGGIPLVQAAGGLVRDRPAAEWSEFESFDPKALRAWRGPLAIGEAQAVTAFCEGI